MNCEEWRNNYFNQTWTKLNLILTTFTRSKRLMVEATGQQSFSTFPNHILAAMTTRDLLRQQWKYPVFSFSMVSIIMSYITPKKVFQCTTFVLIFFVMRNITYNISPPPIKIYFYIMTSLLKFTIFAKFKINLTGEAKSGSRWKRK